jgi:hypothetical protein
VPGTDWVSGISGSYSKRAEMGERKVDGKMLIHFISRSELACRGSETSFLNDLCPFDGLAFVRSNAAQR